jgi:hypothetical protein
MRLLLLSLLLLTPYAFADHHCKCGDSCKCEQCKDGECKCEGKCECGDKCDCSGCKKE